MCVYQEAAKLCSAQDPQPNRRWRGKGFRRRGGIRPSIDGETVRGEEEDSKGWEKIEEGRVGWRDLMISEGRPLAFVFSNPRLTGSHQVYQPTGKCSLARSPF